MGEAVNGADLTPEMVWAGYSEGYFPMTVYANEVEWLYPRRRTLFPIAGLHVSKSLKKTLRQGRYEVRFDTAFQQVMERCVRPDENWISEDFVRVYTQIHDQGWAHSAEAWEGGELVGGVYGVAIGACFCAESMFYVRTDASKVALCALLDKCRELGFIAVDAQIMSPHLASLGAYDVPHEEYMAILKAALARTTPWSLPGPPKAARS